MADEQLIKPRELPAATTVFADDAIMTDDGVTVAKATPVQIVDAGAPVASQAEAIAGTDNTKRMTPLTVRQVLDNTSAPAVLRAQAWAESATTPDPSMPGSKSSRTWALEAAQSASDAADAADAAYHWANVAEDAARVVDRPILVFASGQSNMSRYETYSWIPPENVRLWNHDPMTDAATHIGTAFGQLPSDKISVSWSFAAEIARANPLRTVYVVNTAQAGQPISKWLPGGGAPDLYATGKNNIEAALSVIDEEVDLVHLWWQGENDAANPSNYIADFSAYRARLSGESWWPRDTPIAVFGVSPFRSGTPGLQAKRFNKFLALAAAEDPEKVNYVATSTFATGSGAWNVGDDYLHVTALGHLLTGRLAHRVVYEGMGRADIAGMAVDPDTKQLLQPNAYIFAAAKGLSTSGNITGYNAPFINTIGSAFDPTTGIFTVPVSGLWVIDNMLIGGGSPVTQQLLLNGSNFSNGSAAILSVEGSLQISITHLFQEGDQLRLFASVGAPDATRFGARFVG